MRSLLETEVVSARVNGEINRGDEQDVIANNQHSEDTSRNHYQKKTTTTR
jgi:hypothetical protein